MSQINPLGLLQVSASGRRAEYGHIDLSSDDKNQSSFDPLCWGFIPRASRVKSYIEMHVTCHEFQVHCLKLSPKQECWSMHIHVHLTNVSFQLLSSEGFPQQILCFHVTLSFASCSVTPTPFISSFTKSMNLLCVTNTLSIWAVVWFYVHLYPCAADLTFPSCLKRATVCKCH